MDNLLARFANAFPLWVLACSALALWHPQLFTWFSGPWITWGLGVIMLGMGITLTTLTTLSTILAVAMTPWLTAQLAGARMPVDAWGLFTSTVQVVLLPVTVGVLLNRFSPQLTAQVVRVSPSVAVIVIALIVASVLGAGREKVLDAGPRLLAAVILLHASGFVFGYILSKLWNRSETVARTVSIEVGMQNSGLGAHLTRTHFPAGSGVDIPSAISALTHCMIGSLLAAIWRRIDTKD